MKGQNTDSIPIHSPNPLPLDEDEAAAPPPERTENRKEAAYQIYRDLILENIEYVPYKIGKLQIQGFSEPATPNKTKQSYHITQKAVRQEKRAAFLRG